MPIGFDPNDTVDLKLDIDKHLSDDKRAVWSLRFLSSSDCLKVDRLRKKAASAADEEEAHRLLNEAIQVGIVGWSNVFDRDGKPLPFPGGLDDALMPGQKFRLCREYPYAAGLNETDLKKSPSQSASTTAKDANTTTPGNA